MSTSDLDRAQSNPLLAGTQSWAHLVQAVGPASMLVAIEGRLGPVLKLRVQAEDIWQETLLHAWRDRELCQWSDVRGFRRWLLGVADHRIADARDFFAAQKRDGKRERPLIRPGSVADGSWQAEPSGSTTPSRLAVQREQADHMGRALQSVPVEMREVLQLRLFDGLTIPDIAAQLGIGESAAKHRYRKGAELYRDCLHRYLRTASERNS